MKIRHISGPKAGLIEHCENTVGRTLIQMGIAQAIPFPRRGDTGWLEAIREIDALNTKPHAEDVVPPSANGEQWTVTVTASLQVRVVHKVNGEVWWYDGPPKFAPEHVRTEFIQAASVNPGANLQALEKAKSEQANYEAKLLSSAATTRATVNFK